MKNFDDIEKLWRQQNITAPSDPRKTRAVQATVARDANRYGRLLKWGIFILLFGIFVGQLLMVVNYLHGKWPLTFSNVLEHLVSLTFQIGLLILVLRRHRAHQTLLKKSAASVRENVSVALAVVEREMHHYRTDAWILPAYLLLASVSLGDHFVSGRFDATGMLGRLLFIWGLGGVLGAVALRHYRRVLGPQKQQLTELLNDLDET
jgi:hypothetical protein